MPREQINFPAPFEARCACGENAKCSNCPPPVHGESWPEPELSVSWNKAADYGPGHVQVSLLLPAAYLKHLAADSVDTDTAAVGAFSPALPREEVNRLIRVLRQARDQAYGRDE